LFSRLKADIQAVFERDPAVKSALEAVLCYPGLHALWLYRLAHPLYKRGWFLLARVISNIARIFTGIDIHPGAEIGEGLFIDHGCGVVIGETAVIGNNVTIYQGVTLGGTGKEKGKRHPTIGNNVVIAAGAKLLGSFTVGDHSKIGAGSVVLQAVPPYSTVVGIPGKVVSRYGQRVKDEKTEKEEKAALNDDLMHNNLPDPVAEMLLAMQRDIRRLEERLAYLESRQQPASCSGDQSERAPGFEAEEKP